MDPEKPFDEEPSPHGSKKSPQFRNKYQDEDRYQTSSPEKSPKEKKSMSDKDSGTPPRPLKVVTDSPRTRSRAARVKKLRGRRDRITVVQNPSSQPPKPKSPESASSASPVRSPNSASTASATKSSLRSSPSTPASSTMSSPGSDKASPGGSRSQSAAVVAAAAARRTIRDRVAGGAAAKIVGKPREEFFVEDSTYASSEPTTSVDVDDYSNTTEELDHARRKARVEYNIGTEKNKRYRPMADTTEDEDSGSEATLPSILDRSEVFHANASAAIIALLNPRQGEVGNIGSVGSNDYASTAFGTDVFSRLSSTMSAGDSATGFSPSRTSAALSASRPGLSNAMLNREESNRELNSYSALDAPEVAINKVPHEPLLNEKAKQKLDLMKKAMIDPSKTLADLLTAIASPEEGEEMDKAYMVRRKNACGALKVLTARPPNRRTIGWTIGVFPALTSVLVDGGEGELEDAFPDVRVRVEYIEARKRAVASLLNLCLLKENRIPLFHCPGLMYALGQTILQDKEEARQGCTAILGYLAKTTENRLLMVKVPQLLDALNNAIKPWNSEAEEKVGRRRIKRYIWSISEDSQSMTTGVRNSISGITTSASDGKTYTSEDFDSGTDYIYSNRSRNDDDSDLTPQMTTSPLSSPTSKSEASKRSFLYDNDPNKYVHSTRQNVFATLLHVVKEKDNAYNLTRHPDLLFTLVEISYMQDSPTHTLALKIIANLTRHKGNSKIIVFNNRHVVPAMVHAMTSNCVISRTHAIYTLQNLSQDKYCRQDIAITKDLVQFLVNRARLSSDVEEKLAAVTTLKNLSDEPSNLIPMTNTPECVATLMQIAHGKDENITEMMQFQACDALATLSHWLRKIASTTSLEQVPIVSEDRPEETVLMNPTLKVITWSQWT